MLHTCLIPESPVVNASANSIRQQACQYGCASTGGKCPCLSALNRRPALQAAICLHIATEKMGYQHCPLTWKEKMDVRKQVHVSVLQQAPYGAACSMQRIREASVQLNCSQDVPPVVQAEMIRPRVT